MPLASIPSPGHAVWRLGPLPVRAYALCVIAGLAVALVVASRRYRRSGGGRGVVLDVAAWAIPFGLAGAFAHAVLLDNRHAFGGEYRLRHAVTGGIGGTRVAAAGVAGRHGRDRRERRARRGRARRARRLDRLPACPDRAGAGRGRGRARGRLRAGRRGAGELVGAAVLRAPVHLVVDGADLACSPGARLRELRHLPARLPVPV